MAVYIVFPFFLLIRCEYHPRTSQPTLDPRELHASVTAALRTPPCLFPYTGTRNYYYGEIRLNIRLPSSNCPPVPREFRPFPVSSLALPLEASFVLLYRCTVRRERRVSHKRTWRSQHCPLSIVSGYFGGGTWKKLYICLHCSVS